MGPLRADDLRRVRVRRRRSSASFPYALCARASSGQAVRGRLDRADWLPCSASGASFFLLIEFFPARLLARRVLHACRASSGIVAPISRSRSRCTRRSSTRRRDPRRGRPSAAAWLRDGVHAPARRWNLLSARGTTDAGRGRIRRDSLQRVVPAIEARSRPAARRRRDHDRLPAPRALPQRDRASGPRSRRRRKLTTSRSSSKWCTRRPNRWPRAHAHSSHRPREPRALRCARWKPAAHIFRPSARRRMDARRRVRRALVPGWRPGWRLWRLEGVGARGTGASEERDDPPPPGGKLSSAERATTAKRTLRRRRVAPRALACCLMDAKVRRRARTRAVLLRGDRSIAPGKWARAAASSTSPPRSAWPWVAPPLAPRPLRLRRGRNRRAATASPTSSSLPERPGDGPEHDTPSAVTIAPAGTRAG